MMIFSYSIPIIYLCYYYSKNKGSISSVISQEECKKSILVGMILMGIFTILYELNRGDKISTIFIILLLIGIYGVILVKEDIYLGYIHYIFAGIVFVSIIGFMINHCYIYSNNSHCNFLNLLLYIQICVLVILLSSLYKNMNIFFCEAILIINFAVYYLYLHFI